MISIQKSGDTINFTFTDSSHYLYGNGTISVPENSLTLTIDESDIVNFKKADSNDIFISATLGEFGKTKAELIQFYKENMVNAGISSGDVETMISSATSGFADSVSYNSTTKYVEFFNGNTKVFSYDASEFVIDGMVDNVEIKTISSGGTNVDVLAITFNVESGKNEIDIPLSDIFDPDLYYTKTEVDSALSGKADTSAVTADIAAAVSGKVDTSAFTSYSGSIESRLSEDEEVTSAALNALNETVEGKVDTSAITSAVTSGSTDAEIPTAKAVYDAIPQGGGGKAIEAGRGIAITTGATADTVSFDLPISGMNSTNLIYNGSGNTVSANYYTCNNVLGKDNILSSKSTNTYKSNDYNTISGNGNKISVSGIGTSVSANFVYGNSNEIASNGGYANTDVNCNFLFGINNNLHTSSSYNVLIGMLNKNETNGGCCFLHGYSNKSCNQYQTIFGTQNTLYNAFESALGQFNNSTSASTTFGDSGNTLFSIGNGTADNARHNAFEVRQNGDIYVPNTDDTSAVNYYTKPMVRLQDYIQHKILQMSQSEYDALANKDANTIYLIIN